MTVALDTMRDLLLAQAAKDPDKVAKCEYATGTEWDNEHEDPIAAVPMCIIGCILVERFDVDPIDLVFEGQTAYRVLGQHTELTPAAALLAGLAQRLQDGTQSHAGLRWATAVEYAVEKAYAFIAAYPGTLTLQDITESRGAKGDLCGVLAGEVYAEKGVPTF